MDREVTSGPNQRAVRPGAPREPSHYALAVTAALPYLALVEAMLDWSDAPAADAQARIAVALSDAVSASDAAGAWLELETPGQPPLRVGAGSLAGGRPSAIAPLALASPDGRPMPGSLWVDGGDSNVAVLRAVQLAAVAAHGRAELRLAADRLAALDAATRGIAGVLSLDSVLQLIVDRVRDLLSSEFAALGIVNEQGAIETFVTSGMSREDRARIGPPPHGRGLLGLIVRENRSFRIANIKDHPQSAGVPPNHPPMTSFLGVPIRVKGRSVGNLYLTNRRGAAEFSEADEHLVELFATHAGIAIENARLYEQVGRIAVVDERDRISRDLHDGVIQSIYGVSLSLEEVAQLIEEEPAAAVDRVDRAIESLNLTIRDLRNFIFGLRPELVDQGTLVAGLATLARELRLNTLIDVEVEVADEGVDLEPHRRSEALQLVREALSNVARHSGAAHVRIAVVTEPATLSLTIADDGRGFVVDEVRPGAHHGLANMRARAERLRGTLSIDTSSRGTRVVVRVPLSAASAAEPALGGVP